MANSVYFNGETITIPGAYSAVDTSSMSTKTDTGAGIIAIIGESTGGEPGAVNFLSDTVTAKRVLKGGELLKACQKAWNPVSATKAGVNVGGANVIAAIRTNQATKSELKVKSGEDVVMRFQSKDWGATNNFQIKMVDGTISGTKTVTVYNPTTGAYENYANMGNVFAIAYTGDQAYAELNIFADSSKAMYLQTKVGADKGSAVEDISIKIDDVKFKNLAGLIEEVRSYENYVVSTNNPYNTRLKASDIDFVSDANIKLSASDAFRVTAVLADLQSRLAAQSKMVELAEYNKSAKLENFAYTEMTGGDEGKSPASWVEFFDKLSNYDIDYIVPLTADMSIQAELLAHISEMSGNMGRERRGVVGGQIGETIPETITRANSVASDRMQVVYGGFYDINDSGNLELYPPYILAAQHAGRVAYLSGGESATHDTYRMAAPEYRLERSEIAALLDAGILPFEFVLSRSAVSPSSSTVRLVQDLTTDVIDRDAIHTERATGALADDINREIRYTLDTMLTGKRATASDLTSASNAVVSVLAKRVSSGDILEYKDVNVVKSGTVIEVNYSVAPTEPNNFTLITAHYYSSTISVSANSSTMGEA